MDITPVVKMTGSKATIWLTLAVAMVEIAGAADYLVGGPAGGWDMSTGFNTWASGHKFAPGDSLTFKYQPFHDVVEVTKAGYDACSAANPVASYSGGATTVPLAAPGKRFFICGIPGHCQAGMKLEVDVGDPTATATTPQPPHHAKQPSLPPTPTPQPPAPAHHAKRPSLPPMPTPPAPAPAPAPVAAHPRHAKHKKRGAGRHCPPARAPVMVSDEADMPLAALAPASTPPPPPPATSAGVAAGSHATWGEVGVVLGLGVLVGCAL